MVILMCLHMLYAPRIGKYNNALYTLAGLPGTLWARNRMMTASGWPVPLIGLGLDSCVSGQMHCSVGFSASTFLLFAMEEEVNWGSVSGCCVIITWLPLNIRKRGELLASGWEYMFHQFLAGQPVSKCVWSAQRAHSVAFRFQIFDTLQLLEVESGFPQLILSCIIWREEWIAGPVSWLETGWFICLSCLSTFPGEIFCFGPWYCHLGSLVWNRCLIWILSL